MVVGMLQSRTGREWLAAAGLLRADHWMRMVDGFNTRRHDR
jgi:hypothetical protein